MLLSLAATAQNNKGLENAQPLPDALYKTGGGKGTNMIRCGRQWGTLYIIDDIRVEHLQELKSEVTICPCPISLPVDINTPTSFKLSREDIGTLPYTDLQDMITLSPSVYQLQRGADVSISGSRGSDVLYVIDGMQVARR